MTNQQQICVNGIDTPFPIPHKTTAPKSFPLSYPEATLCYGKCTYMADTIFGEDLSSKYKQDTSYIDLPFPSRRVSLKSPNTTVGPQRDIRGYVTQASQYTSLDHVRKLELELATAKKQIERAEKACRDLAVWTYNERERLLRELAEAKSVRVPEVPEVRTEMEVGECGSGCQAEQMKGFEPSPFIDAQVEQLIAEEKSRLGSTR